MKANDASGGNGKPKGVVASIREGVAKATGALLSFVGEHPGVVFVGCLVFAAASSAAVNHEDAGGCEEGDALCEGEGADLPPQRSADFPYWDEGQGCYVKNGEREAYVSTYTDLRSGRTRAVWDFSGDNAYDEYERVSGKSWAQDVRYDRFPEHELEDVLSGIDDVS